MMPDLGKYAGTVLSAYVVSLALLAAIVLLTLWQGRRMRHKLDAAERRRKDG
jgi:heme exporter protein D